LIRADEIIIRKEDAYVRYFGFQYNAASSFAYMLTSNLWFFLLVVGVAGTIFLLLKEEIDTSVREEQNII